MNDNNTIGIYPMLEDETCYFIAFDFDDKKMKTITHKYFQFLFKSKSTFFFIGIINQFLF